MRTGWFVYVKPTTRFEEVIRLAHKKKVKSSKKAHWARFELFILVALMGPFADIAHQHLIR